jgi:hypothetical protein
MIVNKHMLLGFYFKTKLTVSKFGRGAKVAIAKVDTVICNFSSGAGDRSKKIYC